jgi:hypothetical protein
MRRNPGPGKTIRVLKGQHAFLTSYFDYLVDLESLPMWLVDWKEITALVSILAVLFYLFYRE